MSTPPPEPDHQDSPARWKQRITRLVLVAILAGAAYYGLTRYREHRAWEAQCAEMARQVEQSGSIAAHVELVKCYEEGYTRK